MNISVLVLILQGALFGFVAGTAFPIFEHPLPFLLLVVTNAASVVLYGLYKAAGE